MLTIKDFEIHDAFREESLNRGLEEKFITRKTKMQPPFSEYVISPAILWGWRFTMILQFKDGLITHVKLLWIDSDLASRESWDDIVMADLTGDFKKLFAFVAEKVSIESIHPSNGSAVWSYPWGNIAVWSEDRSYTEGIMISWV